MAEQEERQLTWEEVKHTAENRVIWRALTDDLRSIRNEEGWVSECCYGFIWLIVVLVQNITDIKIDDALRVTILQQKAVEDLKRILLQKW